MDLRCPHTEGAQMLFFEQKSHGVSNYCKLLGDQEMSWWLFSPCSLAEQTKSNKRFKRILQVAGMFLIVFLFASVYNFNENFGPL